MRYTITVPDDWAMLLRNWAVVESWERNQEISVIDLIREAVRKQYRLDEVDLEVDVEDVGGERKIRTSIKLKSLRPDKAVQLMRFTLAEPLTATKPSIVFLMNKINSTSWMGKEPETCKIIDFHQLAPRHMGEVAEFSIVVEYRPPGWTGEHRGGFWWDGWRIKHLDITREGVLLDGAGKPLEQGKQPVVLTYDVHHKADFNACDFGVQHG